MHPKEFKKVKNGTGHLTHLSLKNSKLFVGSDFTKHKEINKIISTSQSYILYPSKNAINISNQSLNDEISDINIKRTVFLIDATWSCSLKILRDSKNLQALKHISFNNTKVSEFKIKEQPAKHCLSTIESTLNILELLDKWQIENLSNHELEIFLKPFHKMVEYQIKCIDNPLSNAVRYKRFKRLDCVNK
jgi:DTW domain-containing protein YfiP